VLTEEDFLWELQFASLNRGRTPPPFRHVLQASGKFSAYI